MDKIFEQAKDLHVVATYVYLSDDDSYAYKDAKLENKYKKNELLEVFMKGCILVTEDGELFFPTAFTDSVTYGSVSYVTVVSSSGSDVVTVKTARSE